MLPTGNPAAILASAPPPLLSYENFIFIGYILGWLFVPLILIRKKNPVSALAWSLAAIFIPFVGVFFFIIFGASHIQRRLRKKLFHHSRFLRKYTMSSILSESTLSSPTWAEMDAFLMKTGAPPATDGNDVKFYWDGVEAFKDKFADIRAAKHHIHLEYFIFRNDETGNELVQLLAEKALEGVQVRLLIDGVGSLGVWRIFQKLTKAGGKTAVFLPTLGRRFTWGLRNHRKLLICDGKVGYFGGLNVGKEYVCKAKNFGYWRDTHARVTGPSVLSLQRVFVEDWDFAAEELLTGDKFFPEPTLGGEVRLQMQWSGPDQDENASRDAYFHMFTNARKSLWISTPYLVPDGALFQALRHAAQRGVDVRIITQSYPPDHWLTYWAGRFFWDDLLEAGVRIFEYRKGMMHAKVVVADGEMACVGSANIDIRSIRLNFEVNGMFYSRQEVESLTRMFREDQRKSKEVTAAQFRRRPIRYQVLENFCRLFSPLL
jgi:cardiolipin synthase A/B